jgi:hypothetical protein
MPYLHLSLTPQAFIRAGVAVALLVNALLLLGGAVFAEMVEERQPVPTTQADIDSLREEASALHVQLEAVLPIMGDVAEDRVLGLLERAEGGHRITVSSLTNTRERERIGQRDIDLFVTSLELRGERDAVLAFLRELPEVFQGDVLTEGVEVHGAPDAWVARLTLKQAVRG